MLYNCGMRDYPMSLEDFENEFNTEEACRDYIYGLRWPDGFLCSKCGYRKAWNVGKVLYECSNCNYQVSVIAGTIFQDTHKPLRTWFRAIWWVTVQKNGASALGLQRVLGIKSYKTAWTWLQKLRRAMVRPERDKLNGVVEVDETYIGGAEAGLRGRKFIKKALVSVAVEVRGKKLGRIRLQRVKDASGPVLQGFVKESVDVGSKVITDGWDAYKALKGLGYDHEVIIKKDEENLLPHVHLVISLLKRWLIGTHQGAVSKEHLDYYLDEYTFRFNRRTSKSRGLLFYRLLENAVKIEPKPYKSLIKNVRGKKKVNKL
jgi:transposase-like protein